LVLVKIIDSIYTHNFGIWLRSWYSIKRINIDHYTLSEEFF